MYSISLKALIKFSKMANDIDLPGSNRFPRVKMRDPGNEFGLTILPQLQLLQEVNILAKVRQNRWVDIYI